MTIKDIEEFEHAYVSEGPYYLPKCDDICTEKSLPYFNEIFSEIQNEETKKELYCLLRELAFYRDACDGIEDDFYDLSKAYEEERCFIFPFKPGDFVKGPDGTFKKVTSVRFDYGRNCPEIEFEERYVYTDIMVSKGTIGYQDYKSYKKVDNVGEVDVWSNGEDVGYCYDYIYDYYHDNDDCKDYDESEDW